MNKYAYIRVSTKEQNIDRLLHALESFDIPKKNVYCDYQSGKDFERPQYKKLIRKLKKGDLLIVKSIDRLGRNYDEILMQWRHITKTIEADIMILDMPLLDTRKKDGNLTGTLISDIVLQLLAYVAQTEREFINNGRQKELWQRRPRESGWAEHRLKCRKILRRYVRNVHQEKLQFDRHRKC